ncbi:MAG: hypothetical protein H6810_06415 [Phycisphaeraceae bacterium]|nr:MAG: hypothetical protein H6810_06415 [Phycisphaeraceae bacterium]
MRSNWPASCLLWIAVAATARAQLLDLTGPSVPKPGDGRAALTLAASLGRDADAMVGDEHARAKAAWRRFAAALLEAAEKVGPEASEMALSARTLAARGGELDAMIDGADADAAWTVRVALERLAARVPTDQRSLDTTLRDAVAPLIAESKGASPGWFMIEPAPPAGAAIAGDSLGRLLTPAETDPAYAASVARIRRLVGEASFEPNAWISSAVAERLTATRSDALAGLADPASQADAIARLERLAAWARLLAVLDDGSRDAATVSARRAIDEALANDPGLLAGGADRTRALRTVAGLLDDAALLESEDGLTQTLRPAWRVAELRRLDSRRQQLLDIARVITSPRPLTDPAVLARFADVRRSRTALQGLATLSEILTGGADHTGARPPIEPRYKAVGDRLIDLARALDRRDDTDAASGLLESLADWAERHGEWPGETALRAGGPVSAEMARVAGVDASVIVAAVDRARAAWLVAWIGAKDPGDLAVADAWMEDWRRTLGLLFDAATLAPAARGERAPAANAWPGFELSLRALRAVTEGMEDAARSMWEATRDRSPESNTAQAFDRFAPARLAAAVEREITGRVPHPDPGFAGGVGWAEGELAAGAPIESICWGVRVRDAIAAACRYAEEAAARDDWVMAYVRARASEALAGIGER